MAQIVIDISNDTYNRCKNERVGLLPFDIHEVCNAIKNGTVLSKGHGRLVDADTLQRTYCEDNCGARKCTDAMDRCVFIGAVLEAPTIIEADKEGQE